MKQTFLLLNWSIVYTHKRKPSACLIVLWTLSSQLANCTKPPAVLCVTIFSPVFSLFLLHRWQSLVTKATMNQFILLQILVLWTLDGGTHFDLMLDWIRFLRSTQDLYTPGNSQGSEHITDSVTFSQTICLLLGFHWRFEVPWWWYFDYVQIPTLMASGKLRAILLLLFNKSTPAELAKYIILWNNPFRCKYGDCISQQMKAGTFSQSVSQDDFIPSYSGIWIMEGFWTVQSLDNMHNG